MSLALTTEQLGLAESVRRFVAQRMPLGEVRKFIESESASIDDPWKAISQDLCLPSVIVPSEYGGADGTWTDLTVALRELGAGLVPSPLLASGVLAVSAILASDDDELKRTWLPLLAEGTLVGALAVSEPDQAEWSPAAPQTRVTGEVGHEVITGQKSVVLNGVDADLLIVSAFDGQQRGIYLVEAGHPAVVAHPVEGIDPTRSLATVTFDAAPAVAVAGSAECILDRVADAASLALAAEQVGAIQACLEMTVEYAGNRFTFGQQIGAYQGVKHKLADMYLDWALADASVRVAAEAADQGAAEFPLLAAAARATTSPAYVRSALNTMLLHGGIGYTWEHDAHLFYKNAIAGNVLLGDPDYQLDRVSRCLED